MPPDLAFGLGLGAIFLAMGLAIAVVIVALGLADRLSRPRPPRIAQEPRGGAARPENPGIGLHRDPAPAGGPPRSKTEGR